MKIRKVDLGFLVACFFVSCIFLANSITKTRAYEPIEITTSAIRIDAPSETVDISTKVSAPIIEEAIIEPETEIVEPKYGFTDDDIYLLAQLLCGSKNIAGDGEYDIDFATEVNYDEVTKVLCVVMNRVQSDIFPDTVTDVVCQKNQFSVMPKNLTSEPSDIALQVVQEWCESYDQHDKGAACIPIEHLYFTGDGITNTTRAKY